MIATYKRGCAIVAWPGRDSFPLTYMLPHVPAIANGLGVSSEIGELLMVLGAFTPDNNGGFFDGEDRRTASQETIKALLNKHLEVYRREKGSSTALMSQYVTLQYAYCFGVQADALNKVREVVEWVDGWRFIRSPYNEHYVRSGYESWLNQWRGLLWVIDNKPERRSVEVLPTTPPGYDFAAFVQKHSVKFNSLWDMQSLQFEGFKKSKTKLVTEMLMGLGETQSNYGRRILGA